MASLSRLKIYNMALSHIGDDSTVEQVLEESAQGKQCDLWYDYTRLQVLEAFDWSFARKRQILTVIETISDTATDPVYYEWTYRYQYPSDCVAARRISNPNGFAADAVPFEIETSEDNSVRTIFTDMEDAILVYTFDCEQTSLFTSHFADTLAVLLAHRIAFSLTGSRQVASDMFNMYRGMLIAAPMHNANEQVSSPPRDAEWIRNR